MKTLTQRIIEKLRINKNFKGENLDIDELIDEYVDFKEGNKLASTMTQAHAYDYLKSNIEYVAMWDKSQISNEQIHKIVRELEEFINMKDCYTFDYGYRLPNNSNQRKANSIRDMIVNNTRFIEKKVLYEDDRDEFWLFYVKGNKYLFILYGSEYFVRVHISRID